jgi:hypothetical protein
MRSTTSAKDTIASYAPSGGSNYVKPNVGKKEGSWNGDEKNQKSQHGTSMLHKDSFVVVYQKA